MAQLEHHFEKKRLARIPGGDALLHPLHLVRTGGAEHAEDPLNAGLGFEIH